MPGMCGPSACGLGELKTRHPGRAVVVIGPSASGKTTVGKALASRLGWSFVEGDDHHTEAAVRKMASGVPLDDADRAPWLRRLNALLRTRLAHGENIVLACSALKERYRKALARGLGAKVAFAYLKAGRRTLGGRLAARTGHFFEASLLQSQLDALEEPQNALTVDASRPVSAIVATLERSLFQKPLLPSKKSLSPSSSVAASEWIDVSVPLRTGMVHWPGDPGATVEKVQDLERGDPCTLSFLSMGAHAGTHMDAPSHFVKGAPDLDSFAADAAIGRARVVAIGSRRAIELAHVSRLRVREGERLLFKTRNSARCWKSDAFVKDFVHLSAPAARHLAARGVRLVGIDYLSVGAFNGDGRETHEALLGAASGSSKGWTFRGFPRDPSTSPACRSGSRGATARPPARSSAPGAAP